MEYFFEKQRKIMGTAKNVKPMREGYFYQIFCMKITTPAYLPPDPIWFYSYLKKIAEATSTGYTKVQGYFQYNTTTV